MKTRFALALVIGVVALATPAPASAQTQIMRYARTMNVPVNYGMPDFVGGFTFCRLNYVSTQRVRKTGWSDDYPASDFNFMNRLEELTTTVISHWANGDPGFVQVRLTDADLFRCPFIKMQNAADLEFDSEEIAVLRKYFLKGGFLWMDDNWSDIDWGIIKQNLYNILPDYPITELTGDHPLLSVLYSIKKVPQIPSIEQWRRGGAGYGSEGGPGTETPHLYAIFGESGRLMVLVSVNSDVSDSWEREGDNPDYFYRFSGDGYGLGVNLVLWVMSH